MVLTQKDILALIGVDGPIIITAMATHSGMVVVALALVFLSAAIKQLAHTERRRSMQRQNKQKQFFERI